MDDTVWKALFYIPTLSIPVYYLGALICIWRDWVISKRITFGVQAFYGLVYLGAFLYMAITDPFATFNFTYEGVRNMLGYPAIAVTTVNHYYCIDIFLVSAILDVRNGYSDLPISLKFFGTFCILLGLLFAPVGFLFYLIYEWLVRRHQVRNSLVFPGHGHVDTQYPDF